MKYCRYLFIGVIALLVGGCGTTVKESLKVQEAAKSTFGAERTVVILPFADYSDADNLETAFRRSLFINENLTDQFVSNSFNLPVQEDVFDYLVKQNIINVVAYENKRTSQLESELEDEWSAAMKVELQRYIDLTKASGPKTPVLESPGTHGLTPQEVVKIGRRFDADYIVRGRIVQYKERQDPSWSPLKKGLIGFIADGTYRLAYGQAESDKYDNWGQMGAGAAWGAWIGDGVNWPYTGEADQTIFGISGGTMGNTLFWGAVGGALGHMSHKTGKIPQAVVQLRIWVQDAYTGDVVWTNRVDVKVSPESVYADYQYDALFEGATEKAVTTLIDNFVTSAKL